MQLTVGDVVGDGSADIVLGTGGRVVVFNGATSAPVSAFSFFPDSVLGVGDLDGDGKGEIVAALAVPGAGYSWRS